jgi:putative transposase
MLARKSVTQRFSPDGRILDLMEVFRRMTNECIRIGLAEGKTSLKALSLACYPKLKDYEVPSAYKLCAISKASEILGRRRRLSRKHHVRVPHCLKLSLTTCYGVKVLDGKLKMLGGVEVSLNAYTQRFLSQPNLEMRSVTLTPESISISVRKQVERVKCTEMLGIDRNLDNVTVADTLDQVRRFDISQTTAIKSRCRRNKRGFRRNDIKVRKRLFTKYGRLETDGVNSLLHNVSANIVLQAKLRRQAIVMEDLRGIRKLYRKGNGHDANYRSQMNAWSYRELQRQIQYKADWSGIPVIYVTPRGTSVRCSICGHRVLPEENRKLHCANCGLTIDRDVNAARNIAALGLRFKPVGSAGEAMVQEPVRPEAILKVDADQLASGSIQESPPSQQNPQHF